MIGDKERRTDDDTMLGNLPVQLTRLVGREDALAELSSLVWRTRLLSLCGAAGNGKTRLAIAVAEALRADFVGGAWWVDLSSTLEPGLVAQAVATTLLPGAPGNDPAPAAIARRFAESSLLVLDNCEQVVDACAELVVDLLERSQSLRVIVTSRQPLGVPGEQVFRVPGLEDRALELFLERAQEAASSLDPHAPGVREAAHRICRSLDGMPLAIELAAARVPLLGVTQIAERLEGDSSFLRHNSRTAPARHQTLHAALEWSHRLLEPAEQRLFRRLAAFRGTFSLAAAEAVCADGSLAAADVLDLLGVLVDRSLVGVTPEADPPRYALLSTVRQYAEEKLRESPEAPATRERQARFFFELVLEAEPGLAGEDQVHWLARLELEHDNLSEALRWQLTESAEDAARLASLLWPFWYRRGYYREARTWLDQALSRVGEISVAVHADALTKAGEVAFLQCDYGLATERLDGALELIGELGDRQMAATVLQRLGSIAREQGRYADARELHERSLAIFEQLGDRQGVAASNNYLGFAAWLAGDPWTAEDLCGAALEAFNRAGSLQDVAGTLVNLGACALYRGELDRAAERLQEAIALSRRLGFQEGIAWSLHELAIAGRQRRRPAKENAALLREAVLVHRRLGDWWRVASVLEEIAGAVMARQDPRAAVALLAAAEQLRLRLGTPLAPAEAPDRDAALAGLESKLSTAALEAARAEGAAKEIDLAVDEAVAGTDQLTGPPGETGEPEIAPILTPRELAVLELLTAGQTNREIAAALYISPSTAGVHVSNILRKLGAKRRVDAAGMAHKLGLLRVR